MPVMDGVETALKLRELQKANQICSSIKIFLISGDETEINHHRRLCIFD